MARRTAAGSVCALVICCACATTVRDLPAGEVPYEKSGLLAGELVFGGTRIGPSLDLRSETGRVFRLRPQGGTFLVAVPPGSYEVVGFGGYRTKADTITLLAAKGEARYIGSFHAARDGSGELKVLVRDEFARVFERLQRRYPDRLLRVERGLVRSGLLPIQGGGELVIAVERAESYPVWTLVFGFGYGYYGHHHHTRHRHRPRRGAPRRAPPRRS